jgi:hypothetical protein
MRNQKKRVARIERRLNIRPGDELVEFPWPDGRTVLMTRRALDGFMAWLKSREDDGQETMETD